MSGDVSLNIMVQAVSLEKFQDIVEPFSAQTSGWWLVLYGGIAVLLTALLYYWVQARRYYLLQTMNRLRADCQRGRMSPREAARRMAQLLAVANIDDELITNQLKRYRFALQEPTVNDIVTLAQGLRPVLHRVVLPVFSVTHKRSAHSP